MTDKVQKIREEVEKIARSINPYIPDEEGKNSEYEAGRLAMATQILQYIDFLQEEPTSDDLEKASKEWLTPQLDKSYAAYGETKQMELTHFDGYAMLDAIEFGAKWQKEQLMAKAVDGVVHHFEKCKVTSVHYNDPTGVPMAYFTFPEGLSAGDKVKIIVIKED